MFEDPIRFIRGLYLKYGKTFVITLGSKRCVYLYDEQVFLTKILRSPDFSMNNLFVDYIANGLGISRRCLINEDIQQIQLKQYHQYLVGDDLEILNERVHHSLISSMKHDAKLIQENSTKIVNFFDLFGEFMLYAGCDALFGSVFTNEQRNLTPNFYRLFQDFEQATKLGVLRVPFRTILYRSIFENRLKFVKRFYLLKLNNGESNLIHEREELYRSEQYKHLFTEYDIGASQAGILWAAVANTAPLSCWSVVNLFLHPEALDAVREELKENIPLSSTLIFDKEILAKLKILESCITESIRRVSSVSSRREAMRNTSIECLDKTTVGVRKGDIFVYPAFLKHFDSNLFGENPYEYQHDRFVKKSSERKVPSVMLFGSGTHMCPGRYLAINEIKILVVLILQCMDIEFINMSPQDKDDYRKKLPYDYSKLVSSGGPRKGYEDKFNIKYSYKNLEWK